jgi:phage-related minor tail protein
VPLLSIDIEARFAKFQDALNSIERNTQRVAGRMNLSFAALSGTLAGLGSVLSAGALASFFKSAVDAADNINDLNKTTGIAVEKLAGLSLLAKQSGTDLESLATSVNKLSQNIGKDSERFRQLGISAKDPLEAFKQLSDIFVAIEDPQTRAALGAAALGKSWASAAPALAEGSQRIGEIVDKGAKFSGITKEMADNADKLNDQLAEMKAISSGLGNKLAGEMLPAFIDITAAIKKAYEESGKLKAIWVGLGAVGAFAFTDEFSSATIKIQNLNKELSGLEYLRKTAEQKRSNGGLLQKFFGGDSVEDIDKKIGRVKTQIADLQKSMEPKKTTAESPEEVAKKEKAKADAIAKANAFIKKEEVGGGGSRGPVDDPSRKILEGQLRELQRLSEDERDTLAARNDFLQTYYQQDLISITDYFEARHNIQVEALRSQEDLIDQEIEALRTFRARDERERADADNKIAELQDRKIKLQKEAGIESIKLFIEQDRAAKDFEKTLQGINAQLLQEQGLLAQSAGIQFDIANESLSKRLSAERQSALNKGDLASVAARDADIARIDKLRELTVARAQLNELDEAGARIQSELAIVTERAQISAKIGSVNELESLRQISDERLKAAAELKQIADNYALIAERSGDPRLIQNAREMQLEVERLAASADLVRDKFQDVFSSGFESFFEKLSNGTASIKDAFNALFNDIHAQLTKISAQKLSDQLFSKQGAFGGVTDLFSGLFGGGSASSGGLGGLFSWLFKDGGAFAGGNVIPFAKGGIPSIVNSPTFFPMASGGIGLMGEAGPEAIMPLKRDKNGELAVRMVGSRGIERLLPLTRDGSGKLAVKAFAAGAAFTRGMPIMRFAAGGVFNQAQGLAISGGSTNISIKNTFAPGTNQQTINQAAAQMGRAVQRALARNT